MIEVIQRDRRKPRLPRFTPVVAEWMKRKFASPAEPQRYAWPVIARGANTLVFSPTGSGKTLAAFLWAINELLELGDNGDLPAKPYVVYVSPLRALANDIEKNLLTPLREMREIGEQRGDRFPDIRVAVRTGDTLPRERQRMLRQPPQIVITTPESLYLLLSSGFRKHLDALRYVIVDEIHHLCGNKRGAHLAITLERLEELVRARGDAAPGGAALGGPVRIGLSATQSPVEEIARFLVGFGDDGEARDCTVVDLGAHRDLDLQVVAPVPNLVEAKPEEISEAIHQQLFELISSHRTTLIFCNSKHATERVAARLNMMAEERGAALRIGAHHGSMSRALRLEMEDGLKSGALRAIVATSSLELGIDIGHLDLVCQVESPKTVASGLQRVGRAGHLLGLTSRGRLFATTRDDLVDMAVLAREMMAGHLEPVHIPRNCLDVVAQQVAAMTAADGGTAADMLRIIRRCYSFRDIGDDDFTRVLEQLSGRFGDDELFEVRPRINLRGADGEVTSARGALTIVQQNSGTIPERAEYTVHAEDYGKKLGTLDEQFVERLRPGQIFLLGSRTWEFLRVDRNRVCVRDGRGRSPTVPYWIGPDYIPRPFELGEQVARFRAEVFERLFGEPEGLREWLAREHRLDDSGAQQVIEFFLEEAHSLDTWPGGDKIVVESFRNPLGHRQVVVHSPYGSRLNEAWAEAIVQAARAEREIDLQATYSDNAFALHLPQDADVSAEELLSLVTSANLAGLVQSYVRESALFSISLRHAAVRALAVLRMAAGRKRAVWQQDAAAKRVEREVAGLAAFPLVVETVRECIEDHLDVANLRTLLVDLESGRRQLVAAEVDVPSPFGHELLLAGQFGAISEVARRERRAELLSLHREVLRQILDDESIRDLLSPKVVEEFESRRQGRHEATRARDADELLRLIRRCGELSDDPASDLFIGHRVTGDWREWLAALWRERTVVSIALPKSAANERRWIASEDYPLYALAFAARLSDDARQNALLDALAERGEATTGELKQVAGAATADLLRGLEMAYQVVRCAQDDGQTRWALAAHWLPATGGKAISRLAARRAIVLRVLRAWGPVGVDDLCARYGLTPRTAETVLRGLSETGEAQRGDFVGGRPAPQVCLRANLEELHRLALAALRREVEPVGIDRYVDFLLRWQHLHADTVLEGPGAIASVVDQQAGYRGYPRLWERDVIGLRVKGAGAREVGVGVFAGDLRMGQFSMGEERPSPLLSAMTFLPSHRASDLVESPSTEDCSREELSVLKLLRDRGEQALSDISSATALSGAALELALWRLFQRGLVSNTDYASVARCRWIAAPRWERRLFGGGDAEEVEDADDADNARPDSAPSGALDLKGAAELRRAGLRSDQGRWYAVHSIADDAGDEAASARRCRARVRALMGRYGVAARELLLAKSSMSPRDFSRGLRELFLRGQLLRGFFVRELSGDQFALPEALERLREARPAASDAAIMISSADPAAIHLSAVRVADIQNRPLATRYLVLQRGALIAIVDRQAAEDRFFRVRDIRLLYPDGGDDPRRRAALHRHVATAILEYAIRWGKWEAVRIGHIAGEAVSETSPVVRDFLAAGYRLLYGQLRYLLRKRVGARAPEPMRRIVRPEEQKREDIHPTSKPVLDFYHHVITEYTPPADKDMLVFFQCSVSRPYSKSPSHGSMRKAIRLATGKDPKDDFEDCRCHVVVLSSVIGPVPYEMEDTYPADEPGGGVKHMPPEQYLLAKPILAERMAAYLRRWHDRYRVITTFTHDRYGEVMQAARKLAGVEFAVLPDMKGPRLRGGNQYWTKYWIQVFFELLKGMTADEQAEAMKRLAAVKVSIDERRRGRR